MKSIGVGKKVYHYLKSNIKKWVALVPFLPKKYFCSVCGKRVTFFLNYGRKSDVFHEREIAGGGYRKNVLCPVCGANDRIRWVDYILREKTDIYENSNNVILHIAPESCIERKIRKATSYYKTGDIKKGKADEVVDITNMQYQDKMYDYIIVNHVLEHVKDEKKAMSEIRRVLKDTGKLFFSVPICTEKDTFEVSGDISAAQRLELYGQEDHVRLYGRNTRVHMESYGFNIKEYKVDDCSLEEIEKFRYCRGDRVFLGEKN